MKLVYTHPSFIIVAQARTVLDLAGIKCTLRNEYAAGAIGVLAPIDTWPELWVSNDRDVERAQRLIEESHSATELADWQCTRCSKSNPGTFESCWHCGGDSISEK